MIRMALRLRRLWRDARGVSVPEFGLISIPLCLLLLGAFDLGYQIYVRATLQGAVQGASRLTTVLTDDTASNDAAIETALRDQVMRILPPGVTPTITKGSFYQFSNINMLEPLTVDLNNNGILDGPVDTDGDGIKDKSDCWLDVDNDGTRNVVTNGKTGIGGADDLVKYTVTVNYNRILPIWRLIPGMSQQVSLSASSLARRQPYRGQIPPTERCRTS